MTEFSATKRLALRGIAAGARLPDNHVNRYQELTYLRSLLRDLEINCVLDVGANTGQFAAELRGSGFHGEILSFEPVARAFQELQHRFRGDQNWRGYPIALGSSDARQSINVDPDFSVMSSLLSPRDSTRETLEEEVDVRRLEGLIDEALADVQNPRVFMKMDTQGYDLEAFEGAGEYRDRILGLQSELAVVPLYEGMPTYLEALGTYQRAGFSLFNLTVVSREESGGVVELNCFMRRD